MKIILAQGNPGAQYAGTRHNVGFFMIDKFTKSHGADFIPRPKFHASIAEISVNGEKILLVKPTTFYNETGQTARALLDFYKLNPTTDFLVIHDDLALRFGTIRTRESGSDAGNNGIKSLNAHIGEHHKRIKIGVYTDLRDKIPDNDFVIGKFSLNEKNALSGVYEHVSDFINSFIEDSFKPTKISVKEV